MRCPGILRQEIANSPFWDAFALNGSASLEDIQERAADNKEFALGNVVLRQAAMEAESQMDSAIESCPPSIRAFSMSFR